MGLWRGCATSGRGAGEARCHRLLEGAKPKERENIKQIHRSGYGRWNSGVPPRHNNRPKKKGGRRVGEDGEEGTDAGESVDGGMPMRQTSASGVGGREVEAT